MNLKKYYDEMDNDDNLNNDPLKILDYQSIKECYEDTHGFYQNELGEFAEYVERFIK